MDSFRNRLLALIIGLVIITQSVTLVAVLASTKHEALVRADEQLRDGSQVVQQYMGWRAEQLSSTVATLADDIGFKDAVASREAATMLSAATGHSQQRIGWDVVIFMDADGRLMASNSPGSSRHTRRPCKNSPTPSPAVARTHTSWCWAITCINSLAHR